MFSFSRTTVMCLRRLTATRQSISGGKRSCLLGSSGGTSFSRVCNRKFSWESVPSLFEIVETGILKYHSFSGLPWWLTIASSTVAVRLALFPLIRLQILNTSEFVKVAPYLRLLRSLLTRRMLVLKADPAQSPLPLFKAYFKGIVASIKHSNLKLGKFLVYPFLNMALFISFIIGIRRLVKSEKASDMEVGGVYWFVNLTKKDPSFIMPLTACFLTYLTLFLSFRRMQAQTKSKFFEKFRDFFSSVAIVVLPITSLQPAAIFCYWIPSSALAAIQSVLLQNQRARALLRLPNVADLAKEAGKKSNIRPSFDPVYFTLHASNKHLKFRPKHLPITNIHLY